MVNFTVKFVVIQCKIRCKFAPPPAAHRLHWVDVKNMYFTSCGGDWRSEQMLGVARKYADLWGPGGIVFTNGYAEPIVDKLKEFGVCALDGSAVFAEQGGQ